MVVVEKVPEQVLPLAEQMLPVLAVAVTVLTWMLSVPEQVMVDDPVVVMLVGLAVTDALGAAVSTMKVLLKGANAESEVLSKARQFQR